LEQAFGVWLCHGPAL
jgi:threonyl-tRNA synthetase